MSRTLPLALILLVLPVLASAQPINGACRDKPVPATVEGTGFAVDGDTLALPGQPRVRLWGVQAPELRDKQTGQETRAGMQARAALEDLLATDRSRVQCRPTKWDRYCRLVALCTVGGTDMAAALLDGGFAYGGWLDDVSPGPADLGIAYAEREAKARHDRRGLWKGWLDD